MTLGPLPPVTRLLAPVTKEASITIGLSGLEKRVEREGKRNVGENSPSLSLRNGGEVGLNGSDSLDVQCILFLPLRAQFKSAKKLSPRIWGVQFTQQVHTMGGPRARE